MKLTRIPVDFGAVTMQLWATPGRLTSGKYVVNFRVESMVNLVFTRTVRTVVNRIYTIRQRLIESWFESKIFFFGNWHSAMSNGICVPALAKKRRKQIRKDNVGNISNKRSSNHILIIII